IYSRLTVSPTGTLNR
nr:RecName: Full=Unknown protein 17 [Pseudotsuga menziesii]